MFCSAADGGGDDGQLSVWPKLLQEWKQDGFAAKRGFLTIVWAVRIRNNMKLIKNLMIKAETSLARLRKSQIITLEATLCNMEEQRSDVGPRANWLTRGLFARVERKKKKKSLEAREKEEKKEERKKEEKKKESEEKMEK